MRSRQDLLLGSIDRWLGRCRHQCRTQAREEAERCETILVGLGSRHAGRDSAFLQQTFERGVQQIDSLGIDLGRVRRQTLHLIAAGTHEPVRAARQREHGIAVEAKVRGQEFGVDWAIRHEAAGLVENRSERAAAKARGHWCANEIHNRRQHVDVLHGLQHAAPAPRIAWLLHDEGHAQ